MNKARSTYPGVLVHLAMDILNLGVWQAVPVRVDSLADVVDSLPSLIVALKGVAMDQTELLLEAHPPAPLFIALGRAILHYARQDSDPLPSVLVPKDLLLSPLLSSPLLDAVSLELALHEIEVKAVHRDQLGNELVPHLVLRRS